MKILLWVFMTLLFIGMLINYPLLFIGISVSIWAIYEWKINFDLKVKSKKPLAILIPGILITLTAIGLYDNNSVENEESTLATTIETKNDNTENESEKLKTEQKDKEAEEKEIEIAEQKEKEEAEEKARLEEEKKKQEEQKKQSLIQENNLELVTVSRVIDGDTIELSDGRKVRLIGVNTPESTTRTEEYGKEASNYTKSKLEGKNIYLQKDVSEADSYNRLLRIVWLDIPTDDLNENEIRTKMFNAELVINGYAEPSTYPPDVKYSEYFVKFAREARSKNVGLWTYGENGTTKGDLDPKESTNTGSKNSGTGSSGSSGSNGQTTPPPSSGGSEYYKNCTELRKVYPDGVPSDHPAYASKHDRDKDGWACER